MAPDVAERERRRARAVGDTLDSRQNAPSGDRSVGDGEARGQRHPVLALLTMLLASGLAIFGFAYLMGYP